MIFAVFPISEPRRKRRKKVGRIEASIWNVSQRNFKARSNFFRKQNLDKSTRSGTMLLPKGSKFRAAPCMMSIMSSSDLLMTRPHLVIQLKRRSGIPRNGSNVCKNKLAHICIGSLACVSERTSARDGICARASGSIVLG